MGEIDFETLSKELLKAVRGNLSQSYLSRKLGYSSKQIHRLEAGERTIGWDVFARACEVCQKDLRNALRGRTLDSFDPNDSVMVMNSILGAVKLSKLERDTKISRFSLMRWKTGKASPPLSAVLQLIDYCQFNLFEFLNTLVDPSMLPSIKEAYLLRQRQKEIYYQFPETAAVIVCLQLEEYKSLPVHKDGFISMKLGISIDAERALIENLLAVKRIKLMNGLYTPATESLDFTGSSNQQIHRFMSFWLKRLLNFYEGPGEWTASTSRFGMEVFAVNEEMKELVRDEFRSFQKRIRGILHQKMLAGEYTDQVIVLHSIFYDPLEISHSQ